MEQVFLQSFSNGRSFWMQLKSVAQKNAERRTNAHAKHNSKHVGENKKDPTEVRS